MQISQLLMTEWRTQQIVKQYSQTLQKDECLYALNVMNGITFRKIKIKNKKAFKSLYSIFNPVYIISFPLEDEEDVRIIGMIIEFMQREKIIKPN